MGGLHGGLLVQPSPAAPLPASYTALTKHTLVLSHLQLDQVRVNGSVSQGCVQGAGCSVAQGCPAGTMDSPFQLFRSYSISELSNELGSELGLDLQLDGGAAPNRYVVNGQYQPTLSLTVGEYRVLRVVNTGGQHTVDWQVPDGCEMTLLAIDGVFLTATQPKRLVRMTQAGRWEIMTRCRAAGSFPIAVTFGEMPRIQQTLLTLQVDEAAAATPSSGLVGVSNADLASIVRPSYLADLRSATVTFKSALHFGHLPGLSSSSCNQWMGVGSDCSAVWKGSATASSDPNNNSCPFRLFSHAGVPDAAIGNGTSRWTEEQAPAFPLVTALGAVNEWRLYGMGVTYAGSPVAPPADHGGHVMASMDGMAGSTGAGAAGDSMADMEMGMEMDTHPFHLHVHHFQIVGFTPSLTAAGTAAVDYRDYFSLGEWRDTVPTLDGELIIRFAASRFPGETILHCHVLRHEDVGMMSSVYVCDPEAEGACPHAVMTALDSHSAAQSATGGWTTLLTAAAAAAAAFAAHLL